LVDAILTLYDAVSPKKLRKAKQTNHTRKFAPTVKGKRMNVGAAQEFFALNLHFRRI